MSETTTINNPKNYRAMAVPFPDAEAAGDATAAFLKELYELRNKYRIRELGFAIAVSISGTDEGEEREAMISGHYGDPKYRALLAGFAFGEAKVESEKMVQDAVSHGQRAARAT